MKEDRRVQRTRHLLQESLIALILERGYDDITVQDITDHANLGRATFYLHYRDKDELLRSSLQAIYDELKQTIGLVSKPDLIEQRVFPALIAFQHAEKHRDLYRIMLRGQGAAAMVVQIKTYLATVIQERLEQLFPGVALPVPNVVIAQHVAGSMMALLSWWLENDSPYNAEQMADMFRQLNTQALILYFRSTAPR